MGKEVLIGGSMGTFGPKKVIQKTHKNNTHLTFYALTHVYSSIDQMEVDQVYYVFSLFGVVGEDRKSGSDFFCD